MDVERLQTGEKSLERHERGGDEDKTAVAETASLQSGRDVAAVVAERKKALEHTARSRQEIKNPVLARIESLLSEGLAHEYAALPEDQRKPFREEGERLAIWLEDSFARGKVKPHEILIRLERWLLIIEGKDRYAPWLLQEAYCRTRRILKDMMYTQMGH